jgi:hypothetical protein
VTAPWLEDLLRSLVGAPPEAPGPPARALAPPRLSPTPRAIRRVRACLRALRRDEVSPITGHRGASHGWHVAGEGGGHVIVAQLRAEGGDRRLWGQVLPTDPHVPRDAARGALVHVRTIAGAHLACVDARGEFQLDPAPVAGVVALDLELDAVVVHLAVPPEDRPAGTR